jgi:hypothetical protein
MKNLKILGALVEIQIGDLTISNQTRHLLRQPAR